MSILGGSRSEPYKLGEDEAFVTVPAGVVDVDKVGMEEVALVVVGAVSVALVSTVELPDFGMVDTADAPGVAALDAALLDVWVVVVDVAVCAGVEVEETNGGAFSIYDPDGWTA